MNSTEGDKNEQKYLSKDLDILQCKAILFAVYSSISTLQKSSIGYLDELSTRPNTNNQSILKKLKKINLIEEKEVYLLSLLSNLISNSQHKVTSVHPEYLFNKISESSKYLEFNMSNTYKNSIISIDETVFCSCLSALLVCCTKTKKLNLSFRKREKYFVIKLSSNNLDWLDTSLIDIKHNSLASFGLSLKQLVALYAIDSLNQISVKTYHRHVDGKYTLNFRLPSTSQLNVFD